MKRLISFKNVSKFYYSKGMIASGFTKVSVDFDIGEFVAITGESGSGKSTLLNVISGLDSYEEGELYINGKETSHYTDTDFEDYRRKYISNIFQSFNLVNSYSVYQNVELVLLLNGYSKRKIKSRVLDLIETVGLTKFKNTKVSKLSGGQKQRVAIARALAKDTPIIIADEPTGNLDSKQASEIIELLNNIRKDKLIIIVTHNFEQVEKFATRKIKMHDGRIVEDIKLKEKDTSKEIVESKYKNIKLLEKIRLGVRNSFNIFTKLILMTLVYLFVTCALTSLDALFKKEEIRYKESGTNYVFKNNDRNRIIVLKKDKSEITDNDFTILKNLNHVKNAVKNDIILDSQSYLEGDQSWVNGTFNYLSNFKEELTYGKMPDNDNEVIVKISNYDSFRNEAKNSIGKRFKIHGSELPDGSHLEVILAGVVIDDNQSEENGIVYISDEIAKKYSVAINYEMSKVKLIFQGKEHNSNAIYSNYTLRPSDKVEIGNAIIHDVFESECKNNNCKGARIDVSVHNMFFNESKTFTVTDSFNEKNIKRKLDKSMDESYNSIFINNIEYSSLFDKPSYQSSIFIDDEDNIELVKEELNKNNFDYFAIKDSFVIDRGLTIIRIVKNVVMAIFIIVLFFITYFIIRIILKSRNVYFSTIRMLGANKKICKKILNIELLSYVTISYIIYLIGLLYCYIKNVDINIIKTIINYLTLNNYIVIYIILCVMSLLCSNKFAKKLFKSTAITSIREEV